jgi:hypothetical protein
LKALAMLGGGAFLPVHWGTFCLAMRMGSNPRKSCSSWRQKAVRIW